MKDWIKVTLGTLSLVAGSYIVVIITLVVMTGEY